MILCVRLLVILHFDFTMSVIEFLIVIFYALSSLYPRKVYVLDGALTTVMKDCALC